MTETKKKKKTMPALFTRVYRLLLRYYEMKDAINHTTTLHAYKGMGKVLRILQETGDISQKELSSKVGMSHQALGEFLKKLETRGFIIRTPAIWDKRAMKVKLTEKGKSFEFKDYDDPVGFACLTEEEEENIRNYLEKIGRDTLRLIVQLQYDRDHYKGNAAEAVKNIEI